MTWLRGAAAAAILAIFAVFGITAHRVGQIEQAIDRFIEERTSMTLITTWRSGGMTHTVNTPRDAGETAEQHASRHKEAVEALKAVYPPEA